MSTTLFQVLLQRGVPGTSKDALVAGDRLLSMEDLDYERILELCHRSATEDWETPSLIVEAALRSKQCNRTLFLMAVESLIEKGRPQAWTGPGSEQNFLRMQKAILIGVLRGATYLGGRGDESFDIISFTAFFGRLLIKTSPISMLFGGESYIQRFFEAYKPFMEVPAHRERLYLLLQTIRDEGIERVLPNTVQQSIIKKIVYEAMGNLQLEDQLEAMLRQITNVRTLVKTIKA